MDQEKLRYREISRRKELCRLASLELGSPEAVTLLAILDNISIEERGDYEQATPLTLEEVRCRVPISHHSSGKEIVREHEIPEPWRERFIQASIGSTRFVEGFYAEDWNKFLDEWDAEMRLLDAHRTTS
jgi:hypothetical protein